MDPKSPLPPLNQGEREIRVLHIAPSEILSDPIKCTLKKFHLDDSTAPSYQALSYCWGDAVVTLPILIDENQLQVTTNLHAALQHIRKKDDTVCIWVDAICIDQNDNVEKASQLPMMNDIYRKAESVLVWLGIEADDSDLAMEKITEWGSAHATTDSRYLVEVLSRESFEEESWRAVGKIFKRPYWRRRWILQEILLGQKVHVQCGNSTSPWANFRGMDEAWYQVLRKIDYLPRTREQVDIVKTSQIDTLKLFTDFEEGNPFKKRDRSLYSLLVASTMLQCTNPRDHIYSLMGLAVDAHLYPHVDYNKSVESVYTSFTAAHIELAQDLDILGEAASRLHLKQEDDSGALPSWVPDWRLSSDAGSIPPFAYNASGELGYFNAFSGNVDSTTINPRGLVCDTVEQVYWGSLDDGWPNILFYLISGITMGNDPDHPSGFPLLNVLFKTSMLDVDVRLRGPTATRLSGEEEYSPEIYFQLAEGFLLLVCLQWGYLRDIAFPNEGPTPGAIAEACELNLRFLKEGSEVAQNYPQFETMNSFREYIQAKGNVEWEMGLLRMAQQNCHNITKGKTLFQTEKGYIGLATPGIQYGDLVTVLLGSKTPVILRKEEEEYKLVGDSFVYGLMDGEAVADKAEDDFQYFCIH